MSQNKFRDIAKMIEQRIQTGHYPPQSKLPTHKALAEELGTTAVTVAKAYQLLTQEMKVESFVGRGTYVSEPSPLERAIQASEVETSFNFSIVQPSLAQSAPVLHSALSQAFNQLPNELLGYTENSGLLAHRQAGITWASNFGLEVGSPEQILLASGAQHALDTLIQTYTQPGDTIAVESLTYPGIFSIAELSQRRIVEVAMDAEGMRPDALRECINQHQPKLVIIIPSYQNPTTVTMSPERRQAIAGVIHEHQLWLVEDDIYGFLNPEPIAAITNLIPEQSFHITSLSKALSPALRCAYIKAPLSEVRRLGARIRASIWQGSPLIFELATQLIGSREAFKLARKQQQLARKRQCSAQNQLAEYITSTPDSCYHLWLQLPAYWRQEQFLLEAKNQQLMVSGGNYFSQSDQGARHIRIALMAIHGEDHFEQGLHQLTKLLQEPPITLFQG